jgi:hypothetical protein
MADELIPLDVREFVLAHIESIAHLEALLLLMSKPEKQWTVASVAGQLYISDEQAKPVLDQLCGDDLVLCRDGIYRFNPAPPGQRGIVERLATLYRRHLVPVTKLVHSKPSGVRAFAAAFKLRKDR